MRADLSEDWGQGDLEDGLGEIGTGRPAPWPRREVLGRPSAPGARRRAQTRLPRFAVGRQAWHTVLHAGRRAWPAYRAFRRRLRRDRNVSSLLRQAEPYNPGGTMRGSGNPSGSSPGNWCPSTP